MGARTITFDPGDKLYADVPVPIANWRAEDIAQAEGSPVNAWVDQQNGITLGVLNNAPTYRTDARAGFPGVDFTDGVSALTVN